MEGPPGAGKSTLVAAAVGRAREEGLRVLTCAGGELERGFAFGAVRQLVEPVLAAAAEDERAALLAGAAAPVATLARRGDGGADDDALGPGHALLDAIFWFVAGLAERQPLLLAVDDLHWVDDASLRALDYLARRVAELPVALVAALRPAEPGASAPLLDALRQLPGAERVLLRALSGDAVGAIVREQLPGAGADLCGAYFEASAGNPLYLRELLLTTAGTASRDPDVVRAAAVPTLGERIARRVAAVAPEAPAVAGALAVLGDGVRLEAVAATAGVDAATAARVAHELVRIDVLAADDPVAFAHPVVRHSLYAGLTRTQRDDAHRRAAEVLHAARAPLDAVAVHLEALPPAGAATVAEGLRAAALDALARGAPETAARRLRRALDEQAPSPDRAMLLLDLGRAQHTAGDLGAVEQLAAARALATDPDVHVRATVALADLLAQVGEWTQASAVLEESGARTDLVGELRLELEAVAAAVMVNDARLVAGYAAARSRLVALTEHDAWPAHALAAQLAMADAYRCEPPDVVIPLVERAFEGGRLLAERGAGAWAAPIAVFPLIVLDRYEPALAAIAQVADAARRSASSRGTLTAIGCSGWVHARRGDLRAAEADLHIAFDLAVRSGMAMWFTSMANLFVEVIAERSGLEAMAATIEDFDIPPEYEGTVSAGYLHDARGRLALARGERATAERELRACAASFGPTEIGPTFSPWRSSLALSLPDGQREEAFALVDQELALARRSGLPRPTGIALRAAGLLEGGEAGIGLLRRAVEELERSEARLQLAYARLALGAALRRANKRTAARAELTAALTLAQRCGADRLAERAFDELQAAGARPRRRATTGPAALTARELRVAQLAARGHSNARIAQELFVSAKTVETHLSHVYAKLDLGGQGARRALANALAGGARVHSEDVSFEATAAG